MSKNRRSLRRYKGSGKNLESPSETSITQAHKYRDQDGTIGREQQSPRIGSAVEMDNDYGEYCFKSDNFLISDQNRKMRRWKKN